MSTDDGRCYCDNSIDHEDCEELLSEAHRQAKETCEELGQLRAEARRTAQQLQKIADWQKDVSPSAAEEVRQIADGLTRFVDAQTINAPEGD